MDKMQPIGVLDSGVGGLSVLKCLHQMLPHEDFIYVGDTARTPYGTRTEKEIRSFVGEIIDWLAAKNVKQVVIACNTLTMLGVDSLRGTHPFSVVGMSRGRSSCWQLVRIKKSVCWQHSLLLPADCTKKLFLLQTRKRRFIL